MAEFGVENLASFVFFHTIFQLDRFTVCGCGLAVGQGNETVKLDLLTLKFYHERELWRWQLGVSDTLDHGDMF